MKRLRPHFVRALAAAAILSAVPLAARADDVGELFPNVTPYDETVSNPITKPQLKDAAKPRAPAIGPRHVDRQTPAPASTPDSPFALRPYAATIMHPLVGPDDEKAFSSSYAAAIAKAMAGSTDDRRTTAAAIEAAAETCRNPDLKRYMLLNALGLYIRAGAPLAEREKKAQLVLPLLTERSIPVLQARADALDDLLAAISVSPDQDLVDLSVDAHAALARLQVQAGFPQAATKSLKKARDALVDLRKKSPERLEQLNEAAAWCERANAASILSPRLQATLKSTPGDPLANTTLATLHLALYGNLQQAATFAAKSNRKDLIDFAELFRGNPSASTQASSDEPAHFVALIGALVEIAKATSNSQPFDRYAIAIYAGDHLAQAMDQLPEELRSRARVLLASARDIVEKTGIRRGTEVPQWLATAKTDAPEKTQIKKSTPIFLGEWAIVVTATGWRGNMTINADGTVTEEANHGRHWTISDGKLVIAGSSTDTFDVISKDKMTGINSHNRATVATRVK
jgi:hypothetical protein